MNGIILPEIVDAGVYDSRRAVKNGNVTRRRETSQFEIEIPVEPGGVSYIDDEERKITSDTVICAKPGQQRHTRLPFKCYYIHMLLNDGLLYRILTETPNYFTVEKPDELRKIFISIFECYNSGLDEDEIMMNSLVLKLICAIRAECRNIIKGSEIKPGSFKIIEKAMKFIDANYTEPLTLEDISKHVSLSPIHFHNTFKASTGKTPHEYLTDKRIKRAEKLLVTTEATLSEIAYECGFSSQAYFSAAFKKNTGLTPREYMREIFGRYNSEMK